MNAYRGHLTTVVGDGPEVVIELSDDTIRVLTPDGRVHAWPSDDVRVTGISGDRFWIAFRGEIAVFAPDEPQAFMLEFLPGLKAARTVADAIAAVQTRHPPGGQDDPGSDTSHSRAPTIEMTTASDAPRPRVVAHRAHLPQLADHVQARMNGAGDDGFESPTSETPDTKRRWWSRGQPAPPLRPAPPSADAQRQPEDISVDLTDAHLESAPSQRGLLDTDGGPLDETPGESALLRTLADRHKASEAERRGTYRPRR